MRRSGEEFIHHPWGVACICAELHLDEQTIAAALLHDVVEDTDAELDELRAEFGPEIAQLVEGVTKLTRIQFSSREQAEAENYRKMIVAMAQDVRVILIKLADRLHNMRTIEYLGKQKQVQKAKETLEVYAPLAHRLGIHALKWELEDLSFQILHPRKYAEIKAMVADRRADREEQVEQAGDDPRARAGEGRHPCRDLRPREALLLDLRQDGQEGPRVQRDLRPHGDARDRRALGRGGDARLLRRARDPPLALEADAGAVQGLHRDAEAEPVPLAAHDRDRAVGAAARDPGADARDARGGRARGRRALALQARPRRASRTTSGSTWVQTLMDWQGDEQDAAEFMRTLRTDLFDDEVYVFTPKGEVKTLPAGATPIDFAYAVHTDVGHRTVGAKVNGRIVPLHYRLKNGDFVEILTSKSGRGPSRDWMSLAASSRARNKIRQWFQRETKGETEQKGREALDQALKAQNLPYRKLQGSSVLASVIREMGFKKAEDFYLALGSGQDRHRPGRQQGAAAPEDRRGRRGAARSRSSRRATSAPSPGESLGVVVPGVEDVLVRLAKCCTPVPGDEIRGYISLGRGITIHRADCPNVKALMRNPERFTPVEWEGNATSASFRVQIAVEAWDRARLLEDVARTFAEHGANIVAYGGTVEDGMARNWYTAELGDVKDLRVAAHRRCATSTASSTPTG